MKRLGMIAIAVALGVPALALAQPAARSGAPDIRRVDVSRPVVTDAVRLRRDDVRVDPANPTARRRAYEPNRRRAHDPNRRRWQNHNRRRWQNHNRRRMADTRRRGS